MEISPLYSSNSDADCKISPDPRKSYTKNHHYTHRANLINLQGKKSSNSRQNLNLNLANFGDILSDLSVKEELSLQKNGIKYIKFANVIQHNIRTAEHMKHSN